METQIGASTARIFADQGYRGHTARRSSRSSATRKATIAWGRCFLAHAAGNAANAVLAAVGYNFRRRLAWLALLCAFILSALETIQSSDQRPIAA